MPFHLHPFPAVLLLTAAVLPSLLMGAPAPLRPKPEPLPAIRFKGKPFFPLGTYDTSRVGEAGKLGSMDPDFLAAGGNFADFGLIALPGYKFYEKSGQEAVLAALEKIKNDPGFADVALLVCIDVSILMDNADPAAFGLQSFWEPATGAGLARRKVLLADAVKKLSRYPNVIGYTMDEPENFVWQYYDKHFKQEWKQSKDAGLARQMIEWIGWHVPIVRENHPGALLMPIIAWWNTYEQAAPLYDVLIADTYPAKKPGMKEFEAPLYEVNYDAACQVRAARAAGGGRSAIFMPPIFDRLPGTIPLTLDEQRYVMFAPITRGVMGLHGWRLQRASAEHRRQVIYPVMKEISTLREFFLGEWHDEKVASDRDRPSVDYLRQFQERIRLLDGLEDAGTVKVKDAVPDVSYCLRRHPDGRYLLLAVNNLRTPVTANFTFALSGAPGEMVDNIHGDRIRPEGNQAAIAFPPFGVRACIFRAD